GVPLVRVGDDRAVVAAVQEAVAVVVCRLVGRRPRSCFVGRRVAAVRYPIRRRSSAKLVAVADICRATRVPDGVGREGAGVERVLVTVAVGVAEAGVMAEGRDMCPGCG